MLNHIPIIKAKQENIIFKTKTSKRNLNDHQKLKEAITEKPSEHPQQFMHSQTCTRASTQNKITTTTTKELVIAAIHNRSSHNCYHQRSIFF